MIHEPRPMNPDPRAQTHKPKPINSNPQTQTHELKPTNPDPQNRQSTSDHDPRPMTHDRCQSTLIGRAQREKREERSERGKRKIEERELLR